MTDTNQTKTATTPTQDQNSWKRCSRCGTKSSSRCWSRTYCSRLKRPLNKLSMLQVKEEHSKPTKWQWWVQLIIN